MHVLPIEGKRNRQGSYASVVTIAEMITLKTLRSYCMRHDMQFSVNKASFVLNDSSPLDELTSLNLGLNDDY